jgi:hypothetical protein
MIERSRDRTYKQTLLITGAGVQQICSPDSDWDGMGMGNGSSSAACIARSRRSRAVVRRPPCEGCRRNRQLRPGSLIFAASHSRYSSSCPPHKRSGGPVFPAFDRRNRPWNGCKAEPLDLQAGKTQQQFVPEGIGCSRGQATRIDEPDRDGYREISSVMGTSGIAGL